MGARTGRAPAPALALPPVGAPPASQDRGARAAVACVGLGAAGVAVGRDACARAWPGHAGPIELSGYALLLLSALAATRVATLSWRELGLGGRRPWPRLFGGVALSALLSLPALRHGLALPLLAHALPAAAAIAAVEELVYRGVLYALVCRCAGAGAAVLASSASFALAHAALYPPPVLLLGLLAGLLLGVYRWRCRDLAGPWLAHTLADAATAALAGG